MPAAPGAAAAGTGGEALDPSPWLPLAASQLAGRRRWPPLATAARPGGGRCLAHRPGVDGISFTVHPGTRKPFDLHPTSEIKQGRPSPGGTDWTERLDALSSSRRAHALLRRRLHPPSSAAGEIRRAERGFHERARSITN